MKLHIRRMTRVLAAVLALAMMTGLAPAALAEDAYAMVTASGARIYINGDLSGASAKLPKFTILKVVRAGERISEVTWLGKTGYVDSSCISALDMSAATKAVFQTNGRVYEYPDASSRSVKVAAGTEVNVVMTSGNLALVERGGLLAYTLIKYLKTAPEPAPAETPKVTYEEFEAVVTADSIKIYASPATSSDLLGRLSKGAILTVTAYTDEWAYITYNSNAGFCLISGLERYVAPAPTPAPTPTPDGILDNSAYSNEKKIFYFLVSELGFNPAAACGVLANIERESSFNPTDLNSSSGAYGICQWLGGRKTNLKSYCAKNGYDSASLKGQLYFLKYELQNSYPKVLNYMLAVDDSAQGAYDGGYYWCYYFEIPGNRTASSVKRGNIAKDDYWPEYK